MASATAVETSAQRGGDADGGVANGTTLRVRRTIGDEASAADRVVGFFMHMLAWGGGMVVGPLLLLGTPVGICVLPSRWAAALGASVVTLSLMPRLPESPLFCRLYLRSASLLQRGATLWVAEQVVPHIAEGSMVCYHPHGVVPMGFSLNGAVRAKEVKISHRVSGVQAPVLFRIPILRQMLQLFGCTMPATKAGMYSLFKKSMTFGIIVGGSEEVALHIRGRERLFLKNRAGFLKYAMQFGYKVIIAYNFGESDLYSNVTALRPLNMWLVRNLGFVLPLFWGRWWCPLLPRGDIELHTVYGEVLQLPCLPDPTPEQVEEWHVKYMQAVTRVFDTHKAQFGYASRTLEIM